MSVPSNPPAFPNHPSIQIDGGPNDWIGMTLRDWFAGQALCGLLASGGRAFNLADTDDYAAYAAYRAYTAADAMLTYREQGK